MAGGSPLSPWHDVPLFAGEGLLNFICEIPKETKAKASRTATGCAAAAWGGRGRGGGAMPARQGGASSVKPHAVGQSA